MRAWNVRSAHSAISPHLGAGDGGADLVGVARGPAAGKLPCLGSGGHTTNCPCAPQALQWWWSAPGQTLPQWSRCGRW